MKLKPLIFITLLLGSLFRLFAQQSPSAANNATVPPLVNFSGRLKDLNGKPLTGIVGVTFYLYQEQEGGAPLWMETQNLEPDKSGHYTVMLGSTSSYGLPSDIFLAGEARWLGVQVQGQAEQPRVLLLSVPYALKAADAATVGGLPPSAFVLAVPPGPSPNGTGTSPSSSSSLIGSIGGTGTTDFIPLWTNSTTLGNSALFQSGTGTTAKLGINTTTPASTLDVKGSETVRGSLSLPATGTATATAGTNSEPLSQTASAFNSSTKAATNQSFRWQAEPAGNNTSSPSGTLNLLFGSGTGNPSETGLHIASNGQIAFAKGQIFPGTGTISGVTAGTDLTGGGGSGNVTLSLDTTKVPQLNAANTFTNNQTVTAGLTINGNLFGSTGSFSGNLSATGSLSGGTGSFLGSNSGTIVQATQNGNGNAIAALSKGGAAINATGATAGIVASALVPGAPAGVFGGTVEIGSPFFSFFGGYQTEISGPDQFELALESPISGIGPAMDFNFTGTGLGGRARTTEWEIVATANSAGQGAGKLLFDDVPHSNTSLLTLDSNTDNVGINNLTPIEKLDVAGRIRSQNVAAVATLSSLVAASSGLCLGALTSANSACDTPNLSLTETTGNVPVFIMANINGINMDNCVVANFALVMDGNIIAASNVRTGSGDAIGLSATIVSLQFPARGSHTFEVQESDDTGGCSGFHGTTSVGIPSNTSNNFSTSTLIVREF